MYPSRIDTYERLTKSAVAKHVRSDFRHLAGRPRIATSIGRCARALRHALILALVTGFTIERYLPFPDDEPSQSRPVLDVDGSAVDGLFADTDSSACLVRLRRHAQVRRVERRATGRVYRDG